MDQLLAELNDIRGYFLGAVLMVVVAVWFIFMLVNQFVSVENRRLVSWAIAGVITFFPLYIAFRPLIDAGNLVVAKSVYLYDPVVGALGAMIAVFFIISSALVFIMRCLVISKK